MDTDELIAYLGPNTASINDNLNEVSSSLSAAVAQGIVNSLMSRAVSQHQQQQHHHQLPSELDNALMCQPTTMQDQLQKQHHHQQHQHQQQHRLDSLNLSNLNASANVNANLVTANQSHDLVNDEYVLFT